MIAYHFIYVLHKELGFWSKTKKNQMHEYF